jgi:hypothetical protein
MAEGIDPVPPSLNWDVWLGVAPVRPFEGFVSSLELAGVAGFQHGAAGDFAPILDPVFMAWN